MKMYWSWAPTCTRVTLGQAQQIDSEGLVAVKGAVVCADELWRALSRERQLRPVSAHLASGFHLLPLCGVFGFNEDVNGGHISDGSQIRESGTGSQEGGRVTAKIAVEARW